MLNLNELAAHALETAIKRNYKKDSILKHTATEVIEAQEALIKYRIEKKCINDGCLKDNQCAQSIKEDIKEEYAEEIADVIICALIASAEENIDIEKTIVKKMAKNDLRAVNGDMAHI